MTRPPRRTSRLAAEHPAYPQVPVQPVSHVVAVDPDPAPAPPGDNGSPVMPPPRRRKQLRVQLNTRVRQDLHDRLQSFVVEHDAAVQDVVEAALGEYLDRRASS